MSSWWSALNPFVTVYAEEAHDEEEKDSAEGGEEGRTLVQLHFLDN